MLPWHQSNNSVFLAGCLKSSTPSSKGPGKLLKANGRPVEAANKQARNARSL